jgi:hypothetical protein
VVKNAAKVEKSFEVRVIKRDFFFFLAWLDLVRQSQTRSDKVGQQQAPAEHWWRVLPVAL